MINIKNMNWRWFGTKSVLSFRKVGGLNSLIGILLFTILITNVVCLPTRKPVHNFQIENIDQQKRDELKKLLITVYSKEEDKQSADEENEILATDWSERDKRTLPSPGENDIEGHHTTEKSINHHHPATHHATTESHIEVLLKDEDTESLTIEPTNNDNTESSFFGRKRRELSIQQQQQQKILPVNTKNDTINVMTINVNGSKHNVVNNTVKFNRQSEDLDDEEEEEEDEPGGVGGLIKMFLAPLSSENGIDLDVIAALIGSLSAENPDGTYDFSGITGLVGSLFGPDEDGNGGSDVGGFLGGIVSATLAGLAGPKGGKGVGAFLGNLISATLPALSAPAEKEGATPPGSDSSGFLAGLITSVLGGSSSTSSGGSGDEAGGGSSSFFSKLIQIKLAILRSVFSIVTGLLSSSSR